MALKRTIIIIEVVLNWEVFDKSRLGKAVELSAGTTGSEIVV